MALVFARRTLHDHELPMLRLVVDWALPPYGTSRRVLPHLRLSFAIISLLVNEWRGVVLAPAALVWTRQAEIDFGNGPPMFDLLFID